MWSTVWTARARQVMHGLGPQDALQKPVEYGTRRVTIMLAWEENQIIYRKWIGQCLGLTCTAIQAVAIFVIWSLKVRTREKERSNNWAGFLLLFAFFVCLLFVLRMNCIWSGSPGEGKGKASKRQVKPSNLGNCSLLSTGGCQGGWGSCGRWGVCKPCGSTGTTLIQDVTETNHRKWARTQAPVHDLWEGR